jgi:hypothetical protein
MLRNDGNGASGGLATLFRTITAAWKEALERAWAARRAKAEVAEKTK